jgi:hypothetical protein
MPEDNKKVEIHHVTCNICGYEIPGGDPMLMAEHLVLNHPWDMLENPKFRRGLFSMAERAGAAVADFLKGRMK